jgi:serine/threonine protein kinase
VSDKDIPALHAGVRKPADRIYAAGHHKPVDVWAMGVITYFLLCGYTPFDRDSQAKETEAIIAGDYKFEPVEYWENVSETAKEFITACLTLNPAKRPTAQEILEHKWLSSEHFVADHTGAATDLLPQVKKNFDAKKTCESSLLFFAHCGLFPTDFSQCSPQGGLHHDGHEEDVHTRISFTGCRRLQPQPPKIQGGVGKGQALGCAASSFSPADFLGSQEAVDENNHVIYHLGTDDDGKKAHEVLSAEISKLSVDGKSKAN